MGEDAVTSTSLTMNTGVGLGLGPVFDRWPSDWGDSPTSLTFGDAATAIISPEWLEGVTARLSALEGLAPNWDSYGALPVAVIHANRAVRFLRRFMTDALPRPDVVPLNDGGVQLEWHLPNCRVDFITDEQLPEPVVVTQAGDGEIQETPAHQVPREVLVDLLQHG